MNQQQDLQHQKHTTSQSSHIPRLPNWRSPFYGYAIIFPLALLILFAADMVWWHNMPINETQLYILLLLIVTIMAALWGIGPSLCLLLVGVGLIFDLFLQPFLLGKMFPQLALKTMDMSEGVSALLFVLAGMALSVIVHQREQARIHAQQQEKTCRDAHQQLEDFIGIICHELKTPLAGTLGNIQFAQRKVQKHLLPVVETAHIRRIINSLMHTLLAAKQSVTLETRLVDDLLDASRIQRHTFQVQRRDNCNLVACIDRAISRFEGLRARERIVWQCPANPVLVCGDPDRLEQVVLNYLSNAFKYGKEHTPVVVTLTVDAQTVRVAVHNEGPGLSQQEQQRVWERFYHTPTPMRTATTDDEIPQIGLGIGLSLSQAIVERHEGQVGVESAPGEGTTFWFSLPLTHSCAVNSSRENVRINDETQMGTV